MQARGASTTRQADTKELRRREPPAALRRRPGTPDRRQDRPGW